MGLGCLCVCMQVARSDKFFWIKADRDTEGPSTLLNPLSWFAILAAHSSTWTMVRGCKKLLSVSQLKKKRQILLSQLFDTPASRLTDRSCVVQASNQPVICSVSKSVSLQNVFKQHLAYILCIFSQIVSQSVGTPVDKLICLLFLSPRTEGVKLLWLDLSHLLS